MDSGPHAGELNRRLFGDRIDRGPDTPASLLVTAALHRLTQPAGAQATPSAGRWAVVIADSADLLYYKGQVVRILGIGSGKVHADWGVHWINADDLRTLSQGIPLAMFQRDFREFAPESNHYDQLLIRYEDRGAVPAQAQQALWEYPDTDDTAVERVGRRIADYNALIMGRKWRNFDSGHSLEPLYDRMLFALGPVRNLQEARAAHHLEFIAPDARGWYRADVVTDALRRALRAARSAYPPELVAGAVFTAEALVTHLANDDDEDGTELAAMRSQLDEDTNPGGVFPVSMGGCLSQVRLGHLAHKEHLDQGKLDEGGWTFSSAMPDTTGDGFHLVAMGGDYSAVRKVAEDWIDSHWTPLHPDRDVLARTMGDNRVQRTVRWTLMGSRSHAKAYFRTFYRSSANPALDRVEPSHKAFVDLTDACKRRELVPRGAGDSTDAVEAGLDGPTSAATYGPDDRLCDEVVIGLLPRWTDANDAACRARITSLHARFRGILPEWMYASWGTSVPIPEAEWKWMRAAYDRTTSKMITPDACLVTPGSRKLHRVRLSALYEAALPPAGGEVPFFHDSADDKLLEEQYADNLRQTLLAFVAAQWRSLCRLPMSTSRTYKVVDLAAEYPVWYPFGTHSRTAGSTATRPYETRADGVVQIQLSDESGSFEGVAPEGPVILVEYKCRVENVHGDTAPWSRQYAARNFAKLVTLSGSADRRQAELNSWMLYLCTGILPTHALVVQATRRRSEAKTAADFASLGQAVRDTWDRLMIAHLDEEDGVSYQLLGGDDGSPFGYVGCLTLDYSSKYMKDLLLRFAKAPYGKGTSALYADKHLLVADLDEFTRMGLDPWQVLTGSELMTMQRKAENVSKLLCHGVAMPLNEPVVCIVTLPTMAMKPVRIVSNPIESMLAWPLHPTGTGARALRLALKGTLINSLAPMYDGTRATWADRADWKEARDIYRGTVDVAPGLARMVSATVSIELTGRCYMPLLFSCKHDAAGKMTEASVMCYYGSADTQLGLSDGPVDELGKLVHSGAPIFRPEELDTLQFYKLQKCEGETARTQALRTALYQETLAAATRILAKLTAEFPLKMRDIRLDEFWYLTVNKVYRRNLTADGPLVREFDLYPEDGSPPEQPYNDPPRGLPIPRAACPPGPWTASDAAAHTKELRRVTDKENKVPSRTRGERAAVRKKGMHEALVRCMNRLVNSRLLRGALALAGCDVVAERDLVDEGDDEGDIQSWLDGEEAKARESEGDPDDETEGWWRGVVDTARRDWRGVRERHARLAVFPHRSQRASWTEEALATAAEGQGCVVEVAERHLLADMRNAIARRA